MAQLDASALKLQVDADMAERATVEAEEARHIHRRGFRVGELMLLVALDATSEVAEMPSICHLPGAPQGVLGLINRHGRVMPVVDLQKLFGATRSVKNKQWLLVCGRGEAAVGVLIDGLPERKTFAHSDTIEIATLNHPMRRYAQAAYQQGNENWLDLNTELLFTFVFNVGLATA